MKQLTRSSSYSWWRDSHNSRRQSAWLKNTLEELDENTQNMLNLVEAPADSFAQRSEIFYHNRPQLVNMIEQLYRGYRSLAEQYDHLKGEIRQNVPKAIQAEYGLSFEAYLENPFRKQISGVKNLKHGLKDFLIGQEESDSDSELSEIDNPEPENCNSRSKRCSYQESASIVSSGQEFASTLSYLDFQLDSYVQDCENNKLKKEKAFVQHMNLLENEMDIMKEENTKLRNENEVNVWERNDLQKELDFIKDENTKLRNENGINAHQLQIVMKKVRNLQKENKNYKSMSLVLGCVNGQAARLARSNVRLRNEMCGGNQQSEDTMRSLKDEKRKVEVILEAKENLILEQGFKIKELQIDICNRKQEIDIIKVENTKLRNENEVNAQKMQVLKEKVNNLIKENTKFCKQSKIMSAVLGFLNGQAASFARSNLRLQNEMCGTKQRNENEVKSLSEKVSSLEKENTNLSKQIKIMSDMLVSVKSQAAILSTGNAIRQGNCQSEATVQILKDEKKNGEIILEKEKLVSNLRLEELQTEVFHLRAENTKLRDVNEVNVQKLQHLKENVCNLQKENIDIILEVKEKFISEQSIRIDELQNEICQLLDVNREQEVQLLERDELKREAIRQLCLTLDALGDKNRRLQKALQKATGGEGKSKPTNIVFSSTQDSSWKKFLFSMLDGGARAIAI